MGRDLTRDANWFSPMSLLSADSDSQELVLRKIAVISYHVCYRCGKGSAYESAKYLLNLN